MSNNPVFKFTSLIIVIFIASSCGQPEQVRPVAKPLPTMNDPSKYNSTSISRSTTHQPKPAASIKTKLLAQYDDWKGAPYYYGGLSKTGVDCSGFVYLTYKKLFSISLPRTTTKQSYLGQEISRQELLIGDLIFFKRGRSFRHVGIYIGNGYFLHASSSKGVTLSKLTNDYWAKRFWMAKRIIQ